MLRWTQHWCWLRHTELLYILSKRREFGQ